MTNPLAARELLRARIQMLGQFPFFGAMALRLTPVEEPGLDTMLRTDGTVLGYNPQKVLAAKFDDIVSTTALCTIKCLSLHPWRRGARDQDVWQRSSELAATPVLKDAGFRLPEGALYEDRFRGHTAEQIHSILWRETPPPSSGAGQGQGGSNQDGSQPPPGASRISDAQKGSSGDAQQQPGLGPEQSWQIAGMQAEMMARKAGNMPGAAQKLLDAFRQPQVPWQIILRRFVREQAKTDHNWAYPNRRYLAAGLYLPALRSRKLGSIELFVDTSGSVWSVMDRFADELQGIAAEAEPSKINVRYWDTQHQGTETFYPGDEIKLTPHGGGGTDFTDCFAWLESQDDYEPPACIVFLTDLEARFPTQEPEAPILWAVTGTQRAAPFGEVVTIDPEG